MAKKVSSSADRYKRLMEKVSSMDLGGRGFWRPGQGRSTIRILPPVGDMEFFFKEVGRHYLDTTFFCPILCTDGEEPCPICEVNEALFQAGEKEAANKFRVSRSFWMNVIVRGDEGRGPVIYTPGIMVFNTLASLISDPDYGDISDPDEGFDIKIDRTGEGLKTEYQVRAARNPSPLSDEDEEMDEWLEGARDIEAYIPNQLLSYDELVEKSGVSVYLDAEEEEEEEYEEDEEEETASSKIEKRLARRQKRRRR